MLRVQELVRKWQADIRSQQRVLERQIRDIERDKKAAEKQVRDAAKRGDMRSAKTLAREIVHTKKVKRPPLPLSASAWSAQDAQQEGSPSACGL